MLLLLIYSFLSWVPFFNSAFKKILNSLFCFLLCILFMIECFDRLIKIFAVCLNISVLFIFQNLTIFNINVLFLFKKYLYFFVLSGHHSRKFKQISVLSIIPSYSYLILPLWFLCILLIFFMNFLKSINSILITCAHTYLFCICLLFTLLFFIIKLK